MPDRVTVQIVALVVVLVFALGIWSSGEEFQSQWLRFYSAAVLVAMIALGIFNRLLWRISLLQKLSWVPKDLRGTWKGTLTSHWIDPSTGQRISPKPAYLVIRQTATKLSVVLLTDESRSVSTFSDIATIDSGTTLHYIYINRPELRVDFRSKMHHGSTALDVIGTPPHRLEGRYWTDRDTKGDLEMRDRRRFYADDFEDAESGFRDEGSNG